jgi:opacity protein-like surface antigen
MRKFLLALSVVVFMSATAQAQSAPSAELFGGYSYARVGAGSDHINFNGWNASISGNVGDWAGLVSDFSGYYKNGVDVHSFLFGPRFTRRGVFSPFVHALLGGVRASNGGSETAFGMALGGGVDAKITDAVAFRVLQADYFHTRFAGDSQNNLRLSFGIVFRLGSR